MATLAYADAFYRAPASDGYETVLGYLRDQLSGHGFGRRTGLELREFVVEENARAWTPRSGRVTMEKMGGEIVELHAFDRQADQDRLLLPLGAPIVV